MSLREKNMIRVYMPSIAFFVMSLFMLDGCQAIEGIFKAGVWVGVLVIVGIMALVGGGFALLRR